MQIFSKRSENELAMPNLNLPPGTLIIDPESPKPVLTVFGYTPENFEERTLQHPDEVKEFMQKWPLIWLNVDGLGDEATLRSIAHIFNIHPLALEDIADTSQRAKVEQYDGHATFIVVPMPHPVEHEHEFTTEQLCLYLGERCVVSFQATAPGDCLEVIRNRIRQKKGRVRISNAAYLAYALVDTVIDAFFPIVSTMGDSLDALEARIMEESKNSQIFDIRAVKVNLMRVRRAVWPMRDAILNMTTMEHVWGQDLRPYLRDAADHVARLMDLIETDRMMASDLMELYLNSTSNRLGEVNKFLTVVATIFIPVGAIASIYGMNFDMEKSAWNMPELKWTYGYPFALGLMTAVAATFLIVFWRRGWLGNQFDGNKRKPK